MNKKRLVVIGGGAAGFFCAVNAARMNPELEVMILEKSHRFLSKVRISGGGRCNVTHACQDIPEMASHYPRGKNFVKKAFHYFFVPDTIRWFEDRGVSVVAEEDGRMFPSTGNSETIINCLLDEAAKYNVQLHLSTEVKSIEKVNDGIALTLSDNRNITANAVCVAAGGFPKKEQFDWLSHTGHTIAEPVPSLFTFNIPSHPLTELMGVVNEETEVSIQGTKLKEKGPVLITHWGLSGPAVLKLSARGARELHDMEYSFKVRINWIPGYHDERLRELIRDNRQFKGAVFIGSKNSFDLPHRLWIFLLAQCGIPAGLRWSDLTVPMQNSLIQLLLHFSLDVKGKTTFKEEFVTAGGIPTSEVDVNTMQSKLVPGLYFAGEILDVDGVTGGYNFQHAWTSGWIAAKAISRLKSEK